MKKFLLSAAACIAFAALFSQKHPSFIDKKKFFETDSALSVTLTTDVAKLVGSRWKPAYQPATFSATIGDSAVSEEIRVIARGKMRREICYMPPVKLDFHNSTSPKLYAFNSLKLVNSCKFNDVSEQLLFKEFLIYKIYNLITDRSFRVRLLNLKFEDSKGKKKNELTHGFLIENAKEMAKRSGCREIKEIKIHSELTDRKQMTIVSVFQYMIGNTDFSIVAGHNTVLMRPAADSLAEPIVVPYDFDYAGLVNADYAAPDERLGIETVTQRVYRGYARTMDELNEVFEIFRSQKEKIYSLISGFELLSKRNREGMIDYLDGFYKIIKDSREVKRIFIDEVRQ